MSAGNATDLEQLNSAYEAPIFEGHTKAAVARVIAHIHIEYRGATFCRADVSKSLDFSAAEISKLCRRLVKEGFLHEYPRVPDPQRAGRPIAPLQATDKLAEYVANVPSWKEKAVFFQIKKRLNYSEDETMTYLVALGAHQLGIIDS